MSALSRRKLVYFGGVRQETGDPLPKPLPGTVHRQWVRCGKASCRCSTGEKHGPFYYRFWRAGNRLRKEYVPRCRVEEVKERCAARQQMQNKQRAALNQWRTLSGLLRDVETILAGS